MFRSWVLLAACLLSGCAPRQSGSVHQYEQWLDTRFDAPKYAVGTPHASSDVVFVTQLQSQPEKGLSKVQLKTSPDHVYYVYANQTDRLISPVFSDGYAAVTIPQGRWTYIDASGRFLLPPLFRYVNPFVNGVATAQLAELGTWVLLGKGGSIRELDPSIAFVQPFSAGRAAFYTFHRYSGYIDTKGAMTIKPLFDGARPFCADGTAAVRQGKLWGLINQNGAFVAKPEYEDIRCFSENLAAAKRGKWGFVDKTGAFAIDPHFDSVEDFSEGMAGFKSGAGKYGFVDRKGSVAVPATYSWVYPFQFGIAKVGVRRTNWLIYPLSFVVPADPHYTSWTYIDQHGASVRAGGRD